MTLSSTIQLILLSPAPEGRPSPMAAPTLFVVAALLANGCWAGGGENPGSEFDLTVRSSVAERAADDTVQVRVLVDCSATDYERIGDPSTGSPGTCPPSEWCLVASWFPRSALTPTPTEESGVLRFGVPIEDVALAGAPVASAETCQTDAENPADGATIEVSTSSEAAISDPDLVVDIALSRRQDGVPGDLRLHHRAILINP